MANNTSVKDNTIGISDEQLAYLNDNLDLVHEFIDVYYYQPYNFKYEPRIRGLIIRHRYDSKDRNLEVIVQTSYSGGQPGNYGCIWRDLLQFVEEHDNTPPIFK